MVSVVRKWVLTVPVGEDLHLLETKAIWDCDTPKNNSSLFIFSCWKSLPFYCRLQWMHSLADNNRLLGFFQLLLSFLFTYLFATFKVSISNVSLCSRDIQMLLPVHTPNQTDWLQSDSSPQTTLRRCLPPPMFEPFVIKWLNLSSKMLRFLHRLSTVKHQCHGLNTRREECNSYHVDSFCH